MAKMSLLEIVQSIHNDLDLDEINSIDDTVESQQVAQIVKGSYYAMLGNRNWPHTRRVTQLEGVGNTLRPNYLKIPSTWKQMDSFSYDKSKITDTSIKIDSVTYKEPDDFLRFVSLRNSSNTNVKTVTDTSGVRLLILKDVAPTYWTSFDDQYIVCDSYDDAVNSTLVGSKTQCMAYVEPSWTMTDDFIPDLPSEAFVALVEESKSTASLDLKQAANQKAEQRSVKQQRWLSRKAWTAAGGVDYPDYGRKGRR